ncbi:hypothetical protein [Schumannella soli]|uniref:SbsA Ig-like domain-containing protein n=1 Tax=Schumannella soli TaxID=2590779 RepID=A0A506XSC0_9MICO|nr:hypothetical protein [Schumannella soli]TPW75644.1 hypothetical protein FJ657_07110 [Schumannella soli]
MSAEHPAPGHPPDDAIAAAAARDADEYHLDLGPERRPLGWRGTLAIALAGLLVVVAGLALGNALRPPGIVRADFDGAALIEQQGARVVLHLDRAVDRLATKDVTVSPAASFSVQRSGAAVTLTFPERLRYGTDYRVSLRVPDGKGGTSATVEQSIRTPWPNVYTLLRDAPDPDADQILSRSVDGGATKVAFSAPRIAQYAVLPSQLAVATLGDAGDATLQLVTLPEGSSDTITTPQHASIDLLKSSGPSGLLGYTLTTPPGVEPALDHVLEFYDPTSSSGIGTAVTGLDGEPLSVLDYVWVPGTTSLVAQATDQSLLLIDPTKSAKPVPLGAHGELRGFLPNTATVVVADPDGGSTIDLTTGETTPLAVPEDGQPAEDYRGEVTVLDRAGRYVEVVSSPDFTRGATGFRVVLAGPDGGRVLYQPADDGSRIRQACLSPNAQYLAVEVVSPEGRSDDYPQTPSFTAISTNIVDVSSGAVARGLPGFDPSWC